LQPASRKRERQHDRQALAAGLKQQAVDHVGGHFGGRHRLEGELELAGFDPPQIQQVLGEVPQGGRPWRSGYV
jgi:hypothetical protein